MASATTGASFTGVTVRRKVCGALVSTPLLFVPPLSCAMTVTVAVPVAFVAGVKVSVPLAASAGGTLKRASLLLVTVKESVWVPPSLSLRLLAKPLTVCAPASSATVRGLKPFVSWVVESARL